MNDLLVDLDLLPRCTECKRVLIQNGYPHALLQALRDSLGDNVGFAYNPYWCINCVAPPNWIRVAEEGVPVPENFPPEGILVQIHEIFYNHNFGMVISGDFYAFKEESGHLTLDCMITHWRFLDLEEFPEVGE